MEREIVHGSERMVLHENGNISRPAINMGASGQWRVIGAVTRNNFGNVVRRYTLQDILDNPHEIPWQFANGKQRTFVQDYDHGTMREWRSPWHTVR